MKIYKVTIIWDDGQKETYDALSENIAQQIINNYKMAFGSQIAWAGVYGKVAQSFIRKGVRKNATQTASITNGTRSESRLPCPESDHGTDQAADLLHSD